jgi:hypothetical protein
MLSPELFLRREGYRDVPEVEFRCAQPHQVLGQHHRSHVEHQRHACEAGPLEGHAQLK